MVVKIAAQHVLWRKQLVVVLAIGEEEEARAFYRSRGDNRLSRVDDQTPTIGSYGLHAFEPSIRGEGESGGDRVKPTSGPSLVWSSELSSAATLRF